MKKISIAAVLLMLVSVQVSAHTALSESQPADGSSVAEAPKSLDLSFTESVRLLRMSIARMENDQSQKIDFPFEPVAAASNQFAIALPELTQGNYRIEWAVMGADGHLVPGEISFAVNMAHEEGGSAHGHGHGEDTAPHAAHGHDDH